MVSGLTKLRVKMYLWCSGDSDQHTSQPHHGYLQCCHMQRLRAAAACDVGPHEAVLHVPHSFRLTRLAWSVLSSSIAVPRHHRQRQLLQQGFRAWRAAAAARALQLGHFWERWQVQLPLRQVLHGWRLTQVGLALHSSQTYPHTLVMSVKFSTLSCIHCQTFMQQ